METSSTYTFCPYDAERMLVEASVHDGRAFCPTCGFVDYQNPKPCVAALITRDDKLLLARRGIEPAQGKWDIPGGFVDSGETAEEATVRETEEETCLRVEVIDFLGSIADTYGPMVVSTINLCFVVRILSGHEHAQSDVAALQWFNGRSIPEEDLAFAHQLEVIHRWRRWISNRQPD